MVCCCCCFKIRKKRKLKRKLDSRQQFVNNNRSRTKTNGTLGRLNNALEDDNSETIVAYRVEDGHSRRKTDPVYYISNDLRLEKMQVPNFSTDPPSSSQSREEIFPF